ncbi:MAG: membrane protein insertase YidC, partial [Eikenella corrodens]|nr:membrane protein insertase YidC [Eikenella corrodens]
MESNNELKRTAVFAIIAILTLMVWNYFNPQPQQPEQAAVQTEQQAAAPVAGSDLPPTKPITVSTDTLKAVIDENSGDLRGLDLLKHNSAGDASKIFTLLSDNNEHKY